MKCLIKIYGYQCRLALMIYKFFDKNSGTHKETGVDSDVVSDNQQLAKELQKPTIRNFKQRKVYFLTRDNVQVVDLAGIQLTSKYNNVIRLLLCIIHMFSKYTWAVPLKDKNGS